MFIELPPFSASPSDPNASAEALFDQHTLTLEARPRGLSGGRMQAVVRASRDVHVRHSVAAGTDQPLTYTHAA